MTTVPTKYDSSWYPIPAGYKQCPVCEGTAIVPLTEEELSYSWNKGKTHCACTNCGGQTMSGKALGYTKIDLETGLGCQHIFVGRSAGRCYRIYTCTKCGTNYDIDSGD